MARLKYKISTKTKEEMASRLKATTAKLFEEYGVWDRFRTVIISDDQRNELIIRIDELTDIITEILETNCSVSNYVGSNDEIVVHER